MSESREEYSTTDPATILPQLLAVFTPGQLLLLADLMGEVIARRFGHVEIEVRDDRIFLEIARSCDGGKVVKK